MSTILLYAIMATTFFTLLQGGLTLAADVREEARASENQLRLRRPTLADGFSPWLREILLTAPIRRFDILVRTSGLAIRTERVLIAMIFMVVFIIFFSDVLYLSPLISFGAGFGFGIGLPLLVLMWLRASRLSKLTQQLPETLDMMVRSLKAGHPIPACIALIAKEMPAPIGVEFKRVHETMTYGLDLRDALTKMTERLHTVRELKYVVSAIKIQFATGGNLAEVLSSLSKLMREQQKLKMKIKAISAEGRLSGNILSALPVSVIILINFINPTYYAGIMDEPVMSWVMWFAVSLLFGGYALIRRFVNIRV